MAPFIGQTDTSEEACRVLRDRTRSILLQSGNHDAAQVLSHVRLAFDPHVDTWTIAGRRVLAFRFVLLAPQKLILQLREQPDVRDRIRVALSAAFDSPERVVRELSVALDDRAVAIAPALEPGAHPYRTQHDAAQPPQPSIVRAAAERFARSSGDDVCASILERATIACELVVPATAERRANYRVEVLVDLEDLATAAKEPSLRSRVTDAVRAVAQSPYRTISEVLLVPKLAGAGDPGNAAAGTRHTASVLQDLLAAEGIMSVVLGVTGSGALRLLLYVAGRAALLDVGTDGWHEDTAELPHLRISHDTADLAAAARSIRNVLRRG